MTKVTVPVTQKDREAAASGYFAWCSANPVIPERMLVGSADDHSMVRAFARHRIAADRAGYERGQREAVARIVAWIRTGAMFAYTDKEMADAIEAGEWK